MAGAAVRVEAKITPLPATYPGENRLQIQEGRIASSYKAGHLFFFFLAFSLLYPNLLYLFNHLLVLPCVGNA